MPCEGKLWKPFSTRRTWAAAQQSCVSVGARLAVALTPSELQCVVTNAPSGGDGRVWLGATDELVEGTFVWLTGETLSFGPSVWRSGEPSDDPRFGPEDCLYMFVPGLGGTLGDLSCDAAQSYICQKDIQETSECMNSMNYIKLDFAIKKNCSKFVFWYLSAWGCSYTHSSQY